MVSPVNLAHNKPKLLFVTDDYTKEEIDLKIHFKHFRTDILASIKDWNSGFVYIYRVGNIYKYQKFKLNDFISSDLTNLEPLPTN